MTENDRHILNSRLAVQEASDYCPHYHAVGVWKRLIWHLNNLLKNNDTVAVRPQE